MPSGVLKFIASVLAALFILGSAVFYIYYLGNIQQSYEQAAIEAAKNYAAEANREVESKCGAPVAIEQQPNCAHEIKNASRDQQRREHELYSQRTDALWNSAMGKAAIFGIAIGLISIPLIFITFWEARRAANAGFAANTIAENSSERQLRAYVHVESCSINFEGSETEFVLQARLVNMGQTPAYNLRIMAESYAEQYPLNDGREFFPVTNSHTMTIGPGGDVACAKRIRCNSVDETISAAKKGLIALCLQGVCVYDDAFGNERETYFRWRFAGAVSDQGLVMQAGATGNSAT